MASEDDDPMVAINAWLSASADAPTETNPVVSARPPPPNISSDRSGGPSGGVAVPIVSRAEEHLRAVRHELRKLEGHGMMFDHSRISQLRRRADGIQSHLDVVEHASIARSLYGVRPLGNSTVEDTVATDADAEEAAIQAMKRWISTDQILEVSPSPKEPDATSDAKSGPSSSDSGSDLIDMLDIDDVQMTYEHLMFAAARIDEYIAVVNRRVEDVDGSRNRGDETVRLLKKEAACLEYLLSAKSELLSHAVRVIEIAGAVMAVNAMKGSRLDAGSFDLGDVRSGIRILLFVRRRYIEFLSTAKEALGRMDINPRRYFLPLLKKDVMRAHAGFSVLQQRIGSLCANAQADRRTAFHLTLSLQRIESTLEEHFQAMLYAEQACGIMLVLQGAKASEALSDLRTLYFAIDATDEAVRRSEEALNGAAAQLREESSIVVENPEADSIAKKVAYQRFQLACERQATLRARRDLLAKIRQKVATDHTSMALDRFVDDMLRSLGTSLLGCCHGSSLATSHQPLFHGISDQIASTVSVLDEALDTFDYSSDRAENAAAARGLLASEIRNVLGDQGEMPCEMMAALKLVYASGIYGKDSIDISRPNVDQDIALESDRLVRNRAVLRSQSGSPPPPPSTPPPPPQRTPPPPPQRTPPPPPQRTPSPPPQRTPPPPPQRTPPLPPPEPSHSGWSPGLPAPNPTLREKPKCYMCLNQQAQEASAMTPCCNTPLCSQCGPPLINLFGACPKCNNPLTESQLQLVNS